MWGQTFPTLTPTLQTLTYVPLEFLKPLLNTTHVQGHTSNTNIASNLNHIVDRLASTSHHLSLPPPSVPISTFFMDNFMLLSPSSGFIESSILTYIDSHLAISAATSLETCHEPLPPLACLTNPTPPHTHISRLPPPTPPLYNSMPTLINWILLSLSPYG